MWHDAIIPFDSPMRDCDADPGRACRRQLFGDVSICVKCGEPWRGPSSVAPSGRVIPGDPVVVDRSRGRTNRDERYAKYCLERSIELANADELPF